MMAKAQDFDPSKDDKAAEQIPTIPTESEQPKPADEQPAPEAPAPAEPEAEQPAKPKTKAELEVENANLSARNAELEEMLQALRKMLPKNVTARPGHSVVFIKSNDVPAIPRDGKKYVQGAVNGEKFEVLCDSQVEVADHIAEALKGVISRQA